MFRVDLSFGQFVDIVFEEVANGLPLGVSRLLERKVNLEAAVVCVIAIRFPLVLHISTSGAVVAVSVPVQVIWVILISTRLASLAWIFGSSNDSLPTGKLLNACLQLLLIFSQVVTRKCDCTVV